MTTSILNPVTLGMTDLKVSPIAFGTWQLGGDWGQFDEDEGIAAVQLESGFDSDTTVARDPTET
jgi:aryl-alcohol dehydrogenase-like predicted oxidoreductase